MRIYKFLFVVLDSIQNIVVHLRFSTLCFILCFFNASLIFLLPVTLLIDWGVLTLSTQAIFNHQLKALNNVLDNFLNKKVTLSKVDNNDTIEALLNENKKYQLYKWGNRKGRKSLCVFKTDALFGKFESFAFFDNTSIVIVPKTFCPQHPKDRVLLAHELSHCLSHDLMLILRMQFYVTAIIFPIIALIANGINGIFFITMIMGLVVLLFQIWYKPYIEIEANNYALEVIGTLYGREEMQKSALILLTIRKIELENKRKNIKELATEILQIEFLEKCVNTGALIYQISPMNIRISLSYLALLALTAYSCRMLVADWALSWSVSLFAIAVFFIIYITCRLIATKIWIKRILIFQRIGL